MSESADIAITTLTSIFIITSIVGNSIVCAIIIRNRDMRNPVNYLLVNLAVADVVYSIFLMPTSILSYIFTHPEGMAGKVLCTLLTDGNFAWVGAETSTLTLVTIAIERYYVVVFPHGNKGKLTIRKLKVIIPSFWIFSLIVKIPEFVKEEFNKETDPHFCIQDWSSQEKWIPKALFYVSFTIGVISFTLMSGLYSRVVYTLWFKRDNDNELTYRQKGVLKVRKRVTLMVVTVTAIFGITWIPDLTLHIFEEAGSYKFSPVVFFVTHTMIMFNSAVNPFAYGLINQQFRRKIKGILCCGSNLSVSRVDTVKKSQDIEMGTIIIPPSHAAFSVVKSDVASDSLLSN